MESTKCKLCTWFTNSLCCNDSDSFSHLHHTSSSQVATITLLTYAMLTFACKHRTYLYHLERRLIDGFRLRLGNLFACSNHNLTSRRIDNIVHGYTTKNTFVKRSYNLVPVLQCTTFQTSERTTIFFCYDYIMRNVNQTTS